MAATVPRITDVVFAYEEKVGCTARVNTDRIGQLDITMTVAQYRSIRAQLQNYGYATIPTGDTVAA